jgi:hypothetical protein
MKITNDLATIDSRNILERIDELVEIPTCELSKENLKESIVLLKLYYQYSFTSYGEILIRHTYFNQYLQQLRETGVDMKYHRKEDYITLDFDGVEYYIKY